MNKIGKYKFYLYKHDLPLINKKIKLTKKYL